MGFLLVVGRDKRDAIKRAKRADATGLSRLVLLYRPAGTREALPSTIAGLAPRAVAPQLENELRIAPRFSAKI